MNLSPIKDSTFLLVEDDDNDAFMVRMEFKRAPHHIHLQVVNDGKEAMHYLCGDGQFADRDKHPLPNVILLDLKMPRVNGYEFLEWLRRKSPGGLRLIPVLVMSGSALPQDINRVYALGANSYIVKPTNWRVFKKMVADLGIYWTEHAATPEVPAGN
jgi:CheY-like chemotaxis protein